MNELEKKRCEEYSRILFGKSVKGDDLEELVRASSSFEDFRIRVVYKFANKNENSKQISLRWRNSVAKVEEVPDGNSLLHVLEGLAQKQVELERKMREGNTELLDKLQALDAAATTQASWRINLDEIRYQIAEIRKGLECLEEVPLHRRNGSK
jgi:hypothetical protein